jgi:hypothetical protein
MNAQKRTQAVANLTAEARELFDAMEEAFFEKRLEMAKHLAAKKDHELFGQNEFEVRDQVHELGARTLETAANTRQKKGGIRRS